MLSVTQNALKEKQKETKQTQSTHLGYFNKGENEFVAFFFFFLQTQMNILSYNSIIILLNSFE